MDSSILGDHRMNKNLLYRSIPKVDVILEYEAIQTCIEKYGREIVIDAIPTEAIDPTGAGDSYRAGFLSRFLNGESLEESAKFASSVSSFIIQHQGCQTNMPTFDEAFERMSEFY